MPSVPTKGQGAGKSQTHICSQPWGSEGIFRASVLSAKYIKEFTVLNCVACDHVFLFCFGLVFVFLALLEQSQDVGLQVSWVFTEPRVHNNQEVSLFQVPEGWLQKQALNGWVST